MKEKYVVVDTNCIVKSEEFNTRSEAIAYRDQMRIQYGYEHLSCVRERFDIRIKYIVN